MSFKRRILFALGLLAVTALVLAANLWSGWRYWTERKGNQEHLANVTSLAFSPDKRYLATSARNRTTRLWDLKTKRQLAVWERTAPTRPTSSGFGVFVEGITGAAGGSLGKPNQLSTTKFSPTGEHLVVATQEGYLPSSAEVWIYEVSTHQQKKVVSWETGTVSCLAFSADGRTLALGGSKPFTHEQETRLVDLRTGDERQLYKGRGQDFAVLQVGLQFARNDTVLVQLEVDLLYESTLGVKVWDLKSGRVLQSILGSSSRPALSPDGQRLAIGATELTQITCTASKKAPVRLRGYTDWIKRAVFSPDGKILATCGLLDSNVRLWDVATGYELTNTTAQP